MVFSEILGVNKIAVQNPLGIFPLEGIEGSMCLITGGFYFDGANFAPA